MMFRFSLTLYILYSGFFFNYKDNTQAFFSFESAYLIVCYVL